MLTATLNHRSAASSAVAAIAGPGVPPVEPPMGVNLLQNSRLAGEPGQMATNWAIRHTGEGTYVWADSTDGHRQVRLQGTSGTDRAQIEQLYSIVQGRRYVFSVFCVAIDDASSPDTPIINHANFSAGAIVPGIGTGARPTLGEMVPGQRYHYAFDAMTSGELKLILGPTGAGDVTLVRPMLEQAGELGGYAATGPVEPPPGATGTPYLPYQGRAVGAFVRTEQNQVCPVGRYNDGAGYLAMLPYPGRLAYVQLNLTHRKDGEFTKSRKTGAWGTSDAAALQHPFGDDINWWMRAQAYRYNAASGQIVGAPLHEHDFTFFARSGNPSLASRVACYLPMPIDVLTAGEVIAFVVRNREATRGLDPNRNYPVLNAFGPYGAPPPGLTPPNRVNLLDGDYPVLCEMHGTTFTAHTRGGISVQGSIVAVYETAQLGAVSYPNVVAGHYMRDATASAHRSFIGGGGRVRQTLRPLVDMTVDRLVLGVSRHASAAPAAGLRVTITGPGVSHDQTLPSATLPHAPAEDTSKAYASTMHALGASRDLQANQGYVVELSSDASAASAYLIQGGRDGGYQDTETSATAYHMSPAPPAGWAKVSLHRGSGDAERRVGGVWEPATYPGSGGSVDLPIALMAVGASGGPPNV